MIRRIPHMANRKTSIKAFFVIGLLLIVGCSGGKA